MKCRVEGEEKTNTTPMRPDENLLGTAENHKMAST
jgi:hypothetical protein